MIEPIRRQIGGTYVYVHFADGSKMFEHRYIMSIWLGRLLFDEEIVHHVNEDTMCNHPCNLFVTSHEAHSRYHHTGRGDALSLAEQFGTRYEIVP